MQKFLAAFLVIAGFSLPLTYSAAHAAGDTAAKKTATKTAAKSTTAKKTTTTKKAATKKTAAVQQPSEKDLSTEGMTPSEFSCEEGNSFTVYKKPDDPTYVNLRWRKKMHHLLRKTTTTGAERYEDKSTGLVWLNIPAKSLLLDSKKGNQLANECRNAEQRKALTAPKQDSSALKKK